MAKRRPTEKTPHQRSAPSKPTRQERRQASRAAAKAQQTVNTTAVSYSRQDALALVALGLMVVISYLPAILWGGFVWDDNLCIKVNPVREVSGLWQIWFSPSAIEREVHYWPLVYTTFWLEHKLWGFAPVGYHIVNVLLHLANTLLLWHLLRRLAVPGAWMVAAVFAVHPLHVESVAWVIERKDVLSGLFYLASALAWMRFVAQPSSRWYVWSLVLYAAGLLSKSIVVTLPAALLIYHWWKQGRVTSTDLWRLVPFCVVGLVITVGDLSFYWSGTNTSFDYSLAERTLIAARALWFYAGKLLWPSALAVIYPRWDIHVADPLTGLGYLIAAVVLALALWHFRQQLGRGPLAGALFFAVTISPVLGFVDYTYMKYAFVADRFQYLAGIGVMVVVIGSAAYGVCRLSSMWQKGVLGIAAVVLVVLGLLTWRQASIYRDDETFNRHIITLNPQAGVAYSNLGAVLFEQRRFEEAETHLRHAIALNPQAGDAYSNLGAVLFEQRRFEEAETHLRHAIALNPQAGDAYSNLGAVLSEQRRFEEAETHLRHAIVLNPQAGDAYSNLGAVLSEQRRFEEAETHLSHAVALNPQDMDAFRKLIEVLTQQGHYKEAIDLIAQATALAPTSPQIAELHFLMGQKAQENGQPEMAAGCYMRTIEVDPHHAEALHRFASLRTDQQRYDEALELFQRLIDIDPSDAAAHGNMGVVLFYLGRSDEALRSFDQALSLNPNLENTRANREAVLEAMEGN